MQQGAGGGEEVRAGAVLRRRQALRDPPHQVGEGDHQQDQETEDDAREGPAVAAQQPGDPGEAGEDAGRQRLHTGGGAAAVVDDPVPGAPVPGDRQHVVAVLPQRRGAEEGPGPRRAGTLREAGGGEGRPAPARRPPAPPPAAAHPRRRHGPAGRGARSGLRGSGRVMGGDPDMRGAADAKPIPAPGSATLCRRRARTAAAPADPGGGPMPDAARTDRSTGPAPRPPRPVGAAAARRCLPPARTAGAAAAALALVLLAGAAPGAGAAPRRGEPQATPPPAVGAPGLPSETPATFTPVTDSFDHERREVMIPMRDGVKLHTVILVPRGAERAPILLTRTPYDADALTTHLHSAHLGPILEGYDNATDVIVERRLHPGGPGRPRQVRLRGRLRDEPPPARAAEPDPGRPRHRHLGHHRLAGEERPRDQRQGRHPRHLLRRLPAADGAGPPAPGAARSRCR